MTDSWWGLGVSATDNHGESGNGEGIQIGGQVQMMTHEQIDAVAERACHNPGMLVGPVKSQVVTDAFAMADALDVLDKVKALGFLGDEQVQIGPPPISEEEKAKRRKLRYERCGSFLGRRIKPRNGTLGAFPFTCGIWRDSECLVCFHARLLWLRGRILHAVVKFKKEGSVRVLLSDYDTIREATSGLERCDYLRLPIDDDEAILFVRGSESDAGTEVTYEDAVKMDWPKYVNTPRDKRISGGLGKDAELEDEEGGKAKKVAVYVPVFSPGDGVTHIDELDAWGKAVKATSYLDPHTAEELQEALNKRMKAFEKVIEASGGSLDRGTTGVEKVYVDLTGIVWQRPYQLSMEEARLELERDEGIPF